VGREHFSELRAGHVTVRVLDEIPSLRCDDFVEEIRRSFGEACERGDFRIVHYSIQDDHLHLLVEAEGSGALGRGMKSISSRIARAAQRVFEWTGGVLDGRYHVRWLRSVAEAWNALRYVLLNYRKHIRARFGRTPLPGIDWASSGRWFEGWARNAPPDHKGPRDVAPARSWLLRQGWKRRGLIDPAAVPGF